MASSSKIDSQSYNLQTQVCLVITIYEMSSVCHRLKYYFNAHNNPQTAQTPLNVS